MENQGPFVKWGKEGHLVRREVAHLLNQVRPQGLKDLLWETMSQGVGGAAASKGTHRDGWCVAI